jgi:hypothetical protein
MPYIPKEDRDDPSVKTPGHLNYTISKICHLYLEEHGLNYKELNTVIGVLECAKLELYRMIAAKYEDGKRETNGPVSHLDA